MRSVCLGCTSTGDDMSACSNKRRKVVFQLPEEIIFNILVFLPAHILYDSMRFVCRQWSHIIRDPIFIRAHLFRAPYLMLLQPRVPSRELYYLDFGERDATMKQLNLRFPDYVLACTDGLVVFTDPKDEDIIYVANPVTKQMKTLPPFLSAFLRKAKMISIASVTAGKEYKVICTCFGGRVPRILVVPVGKDVMWKEIHMECESSFPCHLFVRFPFAVEGYLVWAAPDDLRVISLDLKTETLHKVSPPPLPPHAARYDTEMCVVYSRMKNDLCCSYRDGDYWDILVLKDPRSCDWRKLYRVHYRVDINSPYMQFWPFAWVRHGELVVLYSVFYPLLVYNVKTGCSYTFDYKIDDIPELFDHVDSLVSLS